MTHIKLNFGHHYNELLQKANSKKIYLVRNEHMVQDLNQINVMMGDRNANNLFKKHHASFSHWIDGINSKTDLLVLGYQPISKEGYKHLC